MLGLSQDIFRRTGKFYGGYFIFPWFVVGIMATCYRLTGAHLNPVITVANIIRRDKPAGFSSLLALLYIPAQYAGCWGGVALTWWFTRDPGQLTIQRKTGQDNFWYSEAVGMEFAASFMFVLVYLSQSGRFTWTAPETGLQALIIGASYGSLVAWSSRRTGGSLNPAYGFGQNFWDQMDEGAKESFQFIWIYTAIPFLGMVLALAIHMLVHVPGNQHAKEKAVE
uniref:Aquaporin-like protein n=1 Tax=Euplotes harpa TaxID=151035 RepID=A0A7S3IZ41_9SPIT|mmetsp:Transcript_10238/g.11493  ORF Transcript_10238/g.11493 Transcript_10238/m.11493 type:complete len:224 (+) Transcript_10238:22-693(+)